MPVHISLLMRNHSNLSCLLPHFFRRLLISQYFIWDLFDGECDACTKRMCFHDVMYIKCFESSLCWKNVIISLQCVLFNSNYVYFTFVSIVSFVIINYFTTAALIKEHHRLSSQNCHGKSSTSEKLASQRVKTVITSDWYYIS